jgi:hypothetical protein
MKLLPSQKDKIFELIVESGLSPAQFIIKDDNYKDNNTIPNTHTYTGIFLTKTEYYYLFKNSGSSFLSERCPGNDTYFSIIKYSNWKDQIYYFSNWLETLHRELNTPNKWERLKYEIESFEVKFENGEDKFNIEEYEELKNNIKRLKEGLGSIGLSADQVKILNEKLDNVTEFAKTFSKFDLKAYFIGTVTSIIIQLAIPPDNAKTIWLIIKSIFNTFLIN